MLLKISLENWPKSFVELYLFNCFETVFPKKDFENRKRKAVEAEASTALSR